MEAAFQESTVEFTLNGKRVRGPAGSTILDAAKEAGVEIPTLCYHDALEPIGACRMCVVEVEGSRTLVPGCQRQLEPGMVVRTDTERVRKSQQMVVELLQTETDTTRAPRILEYAETYGAAPRRWGVLKPADDEATEAEKGHVRGHVRPGLKIDNELYVRDLDRCILCYRCVEACGEQVQNTFAISVAGRGSGAHIDTGFDSVLPDSACVYCGNCVAVCPTEALVFKTEYDMKECGTWRPESQSVTQSTCPYCGVGCQIELHVQENRIVKATAPFDDPTTRGFLCIKGRFGWEYVHAGQDGARTEDGSADSGEQGKRNADAPLE